MCTGFRAFAVYGVLLAMLVGGVVCAEEAPATEPGEWKTAFVKRGFVGTYKEEWLSGPGSVIRSRTPLAYAGTQVRVQVQGAHKTEVSLAGMALVQGADELGTVVGPRYPITFDGKPGVSFSSGTSAWSDAVAVPVTAGNWYVQDSYGSAKMPYAYDVDFSFCDVAGSEGKESFGKAVKSRVGILNRVDVWTTDARMSVLCYGDSITHGYGSTPNAEARYPDRLAALIGRPTLNLGVNGDVISQTGGVPGMVRGLKGVDTVIVLMGINDVIGGRITSVEAYAGKAEPLIAGLRKQGLRVFIGTLLPAAGYAAYDKKPEQEGLRQGINGWIRGLDEAASEDGPNGVIDFDAALRDPARPERMRVDCQGDWLHPNDAGYARMAAVAAAVLAGEAGAGAEAEAGAEGKAVEQ